MSPANNLNVDWDKENDILYVIRKNFSKNTENLDLLPGVIERRDPASNKIVGLIIQDFSKKLPDGANVGEWALMEFFDLFLDMLNSDAQIHH